MGAEVAIMEGKRESCIGKGELVKRLFKRQGKKENPRGKEKAMVEGSWAILG